MVYERNSLREVLFIFFILFLGSPFHDLRKNYDTISLQLFFSFLGHFFLANQLVKLVIND